MRQPIDDAVRRRRRSPHGAVTCGVVLVLAFALARAQPALAADGPPIVFTDAQVANVLFGGAVRVKESGAGYHRIVVATAELLDWRAAHPAADAGAVTAHLVAVEQHLDAMPDADRDLPATELLGHELKALYATPGAVITGPQATKLLAVVTGRDLAPGVLQVEQRLAGSQQEFGLDVSYAASQATLWTSLRQLASSDPALGSAWQTELGKPTAAQPGGLNPTWSLADLRKIPQLKASSTSTRS